MHGAARGLLARIDAAPALDERFFAEVRAAGAILRKIRLPAGFDWNCLGDPLFFTIPDRAGWLLARPGPLGPEIYDAAAKRVSVGLVESCADEIEGWSVCEIDSVFRPADTPAIALATALTVAATLLLLSRAPGAPAIAAAIAAALLAIHLWRAIALRAQGRARSHVPMALLWQFHQRARGQRLPAQTAQLFRQFRSASDYFLRTPMAPALALAGAAQLIALNLSWNAAAAALTAFALGLRLAQERFGLRRRAALALRTDYLRQLAGEADRIAALATPDFLRTQARAANARIAVASLLEAGLGLGVLATLALAVRGLGLGADLALAAIAFAALFCLVVGLAQAVTGQAIGRTLRGGGGMTASSRRPVRVDRIDRLEVSALTVRLPGQAEPLFANFSLSLSRGETVALIGPSGAGKSTVAKVLLGLVRPTGGRLLANGVDCRRIDAWSYVERISYVDQWRPVGPVVARDFLFGHHHYDADRAWALLDVVGLGDKFRALPMGISSIVSGDLLSLGELNRLLIAKMLIRSSDIFIFDELLSGLEVETTRRILRHLAEVRAAALVISHDAAIVAECDRVVAIGTRP